jgi:LytS/YehU family sensor histidine kinase
VTRLAALLRYTLQLSRVRTTALENEIEAARHYLELEALRFESRLRYTIDVDPEVLEHPIPPMVLQTLVENAVKHGIAQLPAGGAVHVTVRRSADALHIGVRNSGKLRPASEGGIGLANALDRLRLIFGDRVSMQLGQSGTDEVTCDVFIPSPAIRSPVAALHTYSGTDGS